MFAKASRYIYRRRTNSPHGSLNPSFQKKHLLFPFPFPWSVFSERGNEDKSFLVKGKASRGRSNRWTPPIRGKSSARGSSPLLSYSPFLPLSVSTPAFFSTAFLYSLLCWSIGCSLLYKYIATSSGGKHPRSIHSFIMNVYVFDKIPSTCLLISIRKPERCDVKATAR